MFKRGNIVTTLAMLIVGGAIGVIVALLFAPKSGKETRNQIKRNTLGFVDKIKSGRKQAGDNLRKISNWGKYPKVPVEFYQFEDLDTLRKILTQAQNVIPRGNGRCYGDSALAPQIISTLKYNKFLSFDEEKGVIRCQSGVILADILEVIVPKGWFLPVVPGTKLISVGGAIASNVHGKAQHKAGNFADHVLDMEIMLGDGAIVTCSKNENADLFWTTCGGMGLTGVILNATLNLMAIETAYFRQESIKAKNLDHLMDLFEESEDWGYSVAWIDCTIKGKSMGRGYIMRGDHARLLDLTDPDHIKNPLALESGLTVNIPLDFPRFVLNNLSMKIFNLLLYMKHPNGVVKSIENLNSFFFPLDSINNWNRIYGSRGFTQYQFVLPKEKSREGLAKILKKITESGMLSFLGVLKLYKQQTGSLPFAIDGFALALDFPIQNGLFEFLDELDQIVLEYGGRLYLTKDVRMNQKMFKESYPDVEEFTRKIQSLNHGAKFRSFQSDRVGITA